MKVKYKKIETLQDFVEAIRIRVDVFIKEQGFQPGWEPDEEDKIARHFIATDNNVLIVATARVREPKMREFKIERMAVKKEYRGKGIGKGLVEFILRDLMKLKPKRIWLQSQVRSQTFYGKCGFQAVSKPYDLHGCEHIDMVYTSLK